MPYPSRAFIKPQAFRTRVSRRRFHSLIQELSTFGCQFPSAKQEIWIDFNIAECTLGWVAGGGIEELFRKYADVAVWSADFYDSPLWASGR
ncbi:MAG: hypothetical protein JSV66_09880 [Trueperaceae bacterium]|nr:MAG: hypothetical protein JSV66_09880 [Trueperaceae bacterium]